jgi:site-specific recombinase XerC
MKEEQLADGAAVRRCIYTPHFLRATTATLLLDANVDIVKVKDLLGHRHINHLDLRQAPAVYFRELFTLVGDLKKTVYPRPRRL